MWEGCAYQEEWSASKGFVKFDVKIVFNSDSDLFHKI